MMTGYNRFICFRKLVGMAYRYIAVVLVYFEIHYGSCLLTSLGKIKSF